MKASAGDILRIVLPAIASLLLISGLTGTDSATYLAMTLAIGGSLVLWRRRRRRESEAETHFRLYFEHGMVGMASTSTDKRWLQVNPALCRILGYPAQELIGKTWVELTHPDDRALNCEVFERTMRGEIDGYEIEKRFIRSDGLPINTFIAARAIRDASGQVEKFVVMVEDISARVQAETARKASEDSLRAIGDNLPESFIYQCEKDETGRIQFLYVSSGIRHICDIGPETLIKDPDFIRRSISPEQHAAFLTAQQASIREVRDFSMALKILLGNGRSRWLQVNSRPRRLASGRLVWDGIATDITARREAEMQLALLARRANTMLDLPQRIKQLGESRFVEDVSREIADMTGSTHCALHFLPCADESEPEDWTGEAIASRQAVFRNDAGHAVCIPIEEDGHPALLAVAGGKSEPFTKTDLDTVSLLAHEAWRILRRQRAEQALNIATQVVNASPVVCFRWQAQAPWPAIFVSENVSRWGYRVNDLLAGQPAFADIVHPDDLPGTAREVERYLAEARNEYVQEYRILTADRQVIWVLDRTTVLRDADGKPSYLDGVLTDITERKRQAEELTANLAAQRQLNKRLEDAHNQLLQSEKMASIGQLAAGIAHELNNPIGFVHSNLGTLESYLRDVMEIVDTYDKTLGDAVAADSPLRERIARLREERDFAFVRDDIVQLLTESKDGLARVRKIVLDLKSFSHVSEQEWQWADLHQGLDSTLNIVWNELKYKCKVVKEYGDIPKVHCLISQLNQVFMNLLVNAGHAIEQQGTITIRTRREGTDEVCIEIADTGKGIAPEHLGRIFEPFFTTKPVGKGTGLGLSLAYGIVDKHRGRIEVDSQLGVGTCFRVIIPIAAAEPQAAGNAKESSA